MEIREKKRSDLIYVIDRLLKKHRCVFGVVAVGSVATGTPREDSDIDFILFMDPVDHYILPAESIWCPWDDTFHSIFVNDQRIDRDGLPLDVMVRDYRVWSAAGFEWPEMDRAGLSEGWIAYDRNGSIERLIAAKTISDDAVRQRRLDDFILTLDQIMDDGKYRSTLERHGPLAYMRQLDSVVDAIMGALFAYNRKWRFPLEREIEYLHRLAWLPQEFDRKMLKALSTPERTERGYLARGDELNEISMEIVSKLVADGLYGSDPGSEAFIRTHAQPGRAWNMDAWNAKRTR